MPIFASGEFESSDAATRPRPPSLESGEVDFGGAENGIIAGMRA